MTGFTVEVAGISYVHDTRATGRVESWQPISPWTERLVKAREATKISAPTWAMATRRGNAIDHSFCAAECRTQKAAQVASAQLLQETAAARFWQGPGLSTRATTGIVLRPQ